MTHFYSKTTNGFYDSKLMESYLANGTFPADAVELTDEQYLGVTRDKPVGTVVSHDADGFPVAVDPATLYTLDDAQAIKNAALLRAYESARQLPVSYLSTTFQADDASQTVLGKTLAAVTPAGSTPAGFYWVDSSNNHVSMTLAELQGLSTAMFNQGWAAFQHLQDKKAAVNAAATVADVQTIVW